MNAKTSCGINMRLISKGICSMCRYDTCTTDEFISDLAQLAADIAMDPDRQVAREKADLALCAEFGRADARASTQQGSDILSGFPHPGQFEDNIFRPSAREFCEALPGWTPVIENGQLVLTHELTPGSTVFCYTTILKGSIAGNTGDDSIKVSRRDTTDDGRVFWYKDPKMDWINRRVPGDIQNSQDNAQAAAYLATKVLKQVQKMTRPCPKCGTLQVACRDRARKTRIWWKGTGDCQCKVEGGW